MTSNNPKTLIYLEDVMDALNSMMLKGISGWEFTLIDQHNQTVRDVKGRLDELPTAKETLSEELEGLPERAFIWKRKHDEYMAGELYENSDGDVLIGDYLGAGVTPLSAVLALKEKLGAKT